MGRKTKITKREISPDFLYESVLISKFINHIMKDGKKSVARKAVYGALDIIAKKKKNPAEVFEIAIENVSPITEVKSKRVGGATYQVPVVVGKDRRISLAMRWIINASRSRKGRPIEEKLAEEILNAASNTGSAVKKKEDVHRMAEANKAFAHFAW
jgi:small subunit ribosomal protein S7